ncbi:hypothetical protein N7541_006282 [Penicillium brevicompactum]|uniref:Kinesin light chain n=1 Tax=Penicillium brevicompactum TaxID=5074 RepID=A0A9W9R4T3_PENBR|nr:hypothetical protein N7541_006282 [Penicillium brevicompactum]
MASNSISFGATNSGVQVGINHGPIYPPIARPETPPAPLSTCPFRRDTDFVDRGALLEEIYQKGCTPAARIALVGLGGVGKSQLAIECCYKIEERSPQTWVFWIHAANAERFEKSCWDIANRVKIPGRNEPKAKAFQLVHNWLSNKRNGKWVVVLDNVDDSRFLHEIPAEPHTQEGRGASKGCSLLEYLPVTSSGSIIITSRSRNAIDSIVEPCDTIAIGPMNGSDAAELFSKKLGEPATQDANQLIQELDLMPLAIVQAAAHIRHRAPRLTVSQYLRKFQQNDQERARLLNHENGQLRRDKEAKNSILVTWHISFDHIQQVNPAAADVLSLMCLFDRQGIPETLLKHYKRDMHHNYDSESDKNYGFSGILQHPPSLPKEDASIAVPKPASFVGPGSDIASVHSTDNEFEEIVSILRDYSLISIDVDGAAFEMHRLVQLAMRQWLEAHGQLEKWKQCFIDILLLNFPAERWKKWSVCQLLLPHVLSAVTQPPTKERTSEKWAQLVQATAAFTLDKGNYAQSEELATLAFNTRATLFGPQDERTISSLALVGRATRDQGKWKNAECVYQQVIEAYTRISGPENGATLTSMNDLAWVYWEQGRWNEAQELELQVLDVRKRILGPEHPDTLTVMDNLASTYRNQGRWNEAQQLELQVLTDRKRILGPDHPDTLAVMGNLALTYWHQCRWKEAEELEIQVLIDRRRILGPDHPDTLMGMGNLALTYWHQCRWKEAEDLEVQVLKDRKRVLGPEHPDTLMGMGNLALNYQEQGRWIEAEEIGLQVLETRKRVLGPEHPDTLAGMGNLALTYWHQCRWKEAEELEAQTLKDRKRILGPEHPKTLISIGNLAVHYQEQGRWIEAEEIGLQVLEAHRRILGLDHLDTLTSMSNLASNYGHQGRWSEAETLQVQVLKNRKRILGPEHPDTLLGMKSYAHTLWSLNRYSSAIRLMTECVQLLIRILGPEHPASVSAARTLDEWSDIEESPCTGNTRSMPRASSEASYEASF